MRQVDPPNERASWTMFTLATTAKDISTARLGAPLREVSRVAQRPFRASISSGHNHLYRAIGAVELEESLTGEVPLAVAMVG